MGARQGERQRDSGDADGDNKKPKFGRRTSAFRERLAATYSRGIYKTTTIGKTAFDGRVRNGNGSDHSFMATKNLLKNMACSLKTTHRAPRRIFSFTS